MFKIRNIFVLLLKILLFLLLVYFLVIQLHNKNVSLDEFQTLFTNLEFKNYFFGIFAIIFMPLNWILESLKWQKLVSVIQDSFSLKDAIKGVLIGVLFGLMTPNRVGEFGGRLFKIDKGNKAKALNLSMVGGLAQFVITFLFGLSSSVWLISNYFHWKSSFFYALLLIVYLFSLCFYFKFKQLAKFFLSYNRFKIFTDKYVFNFELTNIFLLKLLILTAIRYTVYVFQYVFILYFLGIDLEMIFLVKTISTMLLIQTIIPSFTLIDVGIRGNVLLFLLSEYVDNQLIILVCVLLVWILNLVIPAIIGYINLTNLKLEAKNEKFNNDIITNNRK